MLTILLLVMNRLNKIEIAIFISLMWSLLPKDLTNQNFLWLMGLYEYDKCSYSYAKQLPPSLFSSVGY